MPAGSLARELATALPLGGLLVIALTIVVLCVPTLSTGT